MNKPEKYILEGWDDICEKANKSLHSDCPLLEDEVLVEMHKYVSQMNQRNNELEILLEDLKADLLMRADIDNSEGCNVVNLSDSIWHRLKKAIKDS